jgi:hypothetical protein
MLDLLELRRQFFDAEHAFRDQIVGEREDAPLGIGQRVIDLRTERFERAAIFVARLDLPPLQASV